MSSTQQTFKRSTETGFYNLRKIDVPKGYSPSNEEKFMNPVMLSYFWEKLREKCSDLDESLSSLKAKACQPHSGAERVDTEQTRRAANESLSQIERLKRLHSKVSLMIREIEQEGPKSEYGYCTDSGEEIALKRLDALPWSTRTIESQHTHEKKSKFYAGSLPAFVPAALK